MKRTLLLTVNGLLFLILLLGSIQKLIIPVITLTSVFGLADALSVINTGSLLFLVLPVLMGVLAFNVMQKRWTLASYVGSYAFLVLGVLVLSVSIVMMFIEPELSKPAIAAGAGLVLSVSMWFNRNLLKTYKI